MIEQDEQSTSAAAGILPDEVIADHRSEANLIFLTLAPELGAEGVRAWLADLSAIVAALEAPDESGQRLATAVVGFGPSFFATGAAPRFGLAGRAPHEFADLPAVSGAAQVVADVVVYVASRSQAKLANLLLALWEKRGSALSGLSVEYGFQRPDGRELFGFIDGSRNIPSEDRPRVIFVNTDATPDEVDWADLGSYMAYLKLPQNLEAWAKLTPAERERRMGRRLSDGSRLDLPEGTDPHSEGEYTGAVPEGAAHVRKARPGAPLTAEIFRRGVPFVEVTPAGAVRGGLQFVSFQASLDAFDALLSRWMLAPDFRSAGTGVDLLFTEGLVQVERFGFFFVPPTDPRFLGAAMFDAPQPRRGKGRLFVRKKLVDDAGRRIHGQLDGAVFQVLRGTKPIGGTFTTNASGHAVSPELPVGVELTLHEVTPLPGAQPAADRTFQLEGPHGAMEVRNIQMTPQPQPYR